MDPSHAAPTDESATLVASSDGVDVVVHTLDAGTGSSAPPVLAAHATGFHGRVWMPFAVALSEAPGTAGAMVVAPDLRGHGMTRLPDGVVLDWDGFADDVLAVVDALGLTGAVGVGHSKGGAALLRAEARRPGTFAALWCFEPVVFPPEFARGRFEDNPLAAGALRRRDEFGSREEAFANYAAKPPLNVLDPRCLEAYVAHGFEAVEPGEPDGAVRLRCRPEIEAETYRMGTAHNTFGFLSAVQCPTVIAAGTLDQVGPGAFAGQIAEAMPNGHLALYEGLGHFGPLSHPDRLAADVASFVGGVSGSPGDGHH